MASAPQLPLLYRELIPLSTQEHGGWKARPLADFRMLADVHAMPLTVDEFMAAQRYHPIVFTAGDDPVPLQLFGLNEGVNMFLGEDNMPTPDSYVPAYVRRYPFMLVRLQPDRDDLSLCFDPTADLLGSFEEGTELFEGDQPSSATKETLAFCEQFEMGAQRTGAFVQELKKLDLLTESEVTITSPSRPEPYIYRGFQMVNEEKLRELRGDQLRKMMQNGMLPLIHAHLFSLQLMPALFERQMTAGRVPQG